MKMKTMLAVVMGIPLLLIGCHNFEEWFSGDVKRNPDYNYNVAHVKEAKSTITAKSSKSDNANALVNGYDNTPRPVKHPTLAPNNSGTIDTHKGTTAPLTTAVPNTAPTVGQ